MLLKCYLIIAFFILTFYIGHLTRKKKIWGRTLSIFSCFAILSVVSFIIFFMPDSALNENNAREAAYARSQGLVLGNSLSLKYFGNGKCLVIYSGYSMDEKIQMEQVCKDIKDGFAGKLNEIKLAPLYQIPLLENSTNTDEGAVYPIYNAADFNRVLKENQEYDVVIIAATLPTLISEVYKIDIFSVIVDPEDDTNLIRDPNKKYPLVGIFNGTIYDLDELFKEKFIMAMTTIRPDAVFAEKPAPEKVMEAFNERYTLITPENFESVKSKFSSFR
jgi:hypothetical protein